jgi:CBS domain containing-hemolysin-like protein
MIVWSLVLLIVGVFLSAFFSGSETGFYRASRVKVVMACLDGDRMSLGLLKLFNNPTWFVATTLIGNNVANYLTSLAIVLITGELYRSNLAEMVVPIVMSPLLFIYGELLPKNLCYQAPNTLLRLGAPLFLFFTALFAPAAALLWAMGKLLERFMGQSPEKIRLALARKELQQVLEEGLEAGILQPTQRQLAQSFFLVAAKPVREFCTPLSKIRCVHASNRVAEVLKIANKFALTDIPVISGKKKQLVGYVRTVDLLLADQKTARISGIRELKVIQASELFGEAVMQMQSTRETLSQVVDKKGQPIGILSLDQLTDPLLDGSLMSLRR